MDLPKEGFCRTRNKKIIEFLKTIFPESSKTKTKFTTDHIGVAWDKRDFWSINRVSDKPIKPEISEKTLLEIIGLNSIEKWAVNSYVVVVREDYQGTGHKLTKEPKLPLRLIGQISHKWDDSTTALKNIDTKYGNWVCEKDLFKWFPTLEESEKFRDDSLLAKKSYVKCNSEDEYKFIKERIRTYHPGIFNKDRCIIDLNRPSPTLKITLTMKENPESIMSFRDWCNLNGIWVNSNEEKLLDEAKRRYPIGTKFKCLHGAYGGPITEEDYEFGKDKECIRVLQGRGCIYDNGKWAKIISKPKTAYFNTEFEMNSSLKRELMEDAFTETKRRLPELSKFFNNEFDRDFYIKVNSQEEWLQLCDYFESIGETVSRNGKVYYQGEFWGYVRHSTIEWYLDHSKSDLPEKPLSDFIKPKLVNNKGLKFIIGEKYEHNTLEICYYCGINSKGIPIFELIGYSGPIPNDINIPKGYMSKGNNTYWGYTGIENEFTEIQNDKGIEEESSIECFVPSRGRVKKSKTRETPSIEPVVNRIKASPVKKRKLPEIY